jgi:hypothetical protein
MPQGLQSVPLQCNRKISVWVLAMVPWVHCVLLQAQSVDSLLRGAASCAASGCHGGPRAAVAEPQATRGSEYPLWLERDPHAQSWRTLNSAASLKILDNLGIMQHGKIVDKAQFENCLACHNTSTDTTLAESLPTFPEGVGCEACHGPSANWYDSHFRGPDALQRAQDQLGLSRTKPLLERAEMCARCHVGAADRDMNHDIIAAGHPALYFDMAVYHEKLPKHWRDNEGDSSRFRSELWFAGQLAKLQAELELIEARASEKLAVSCWPELSQYQCSSCHNQLDGLTPRLLSENRERPLLAATGLGQAPARMWNLTGWQLIDDTVRERPHQGLLEESILALQYELPNTSLGPTQIVERNRATMDILESLRNANSSEKWIDDWTLDRHRQWVVSQLRSALDDGDWERAALGYVAAWALVPSFNSDELRSSLETMRAGLLFASRSQAPILPLPSDATASKHPAMQNHTAPPTQAEWRTAVETVIALLDRSEP